MYKEKVRRKSDATSTTRVLPEHNIQRFSVGQGVLKRRAGEESKKEAKEETVEELKRQNAQLTSELESARKELE